MEILLLLGVILACLISLVTAFVAWRTGGQMGDAGRVLDRIDSMEKTLANEFASLRETLEKRMQDLSQQQAKSQLDFLDRSTRTATDTAEQQRRELTEAQMLARKELQEALAGLREDSARNSMTLNKTLVDLQTQTLERLQAATNAQRELTDKTISANAEAQTLHRKETADALAGLREDSVKSGITLNKTLLELQTQLLDRLKANLDVHREFGEKSREAIATGLKALREDNESRLEKLRQTVDEKLQSTLEKRLGESFKQVSERLEQVHRGLGEMQKLATGVGDLKRVLTNVRTRGTFGEVQLRAMLEQSLNTGQYAENIATRPRSSERVEFAVILPGKQDLEGVVYLPIDAKFPQEDFQRLLDAYDGGDAQGIEVARKALATRILGEAVKIREKYIEVPYTTDFGMMYLPTEGLFAEVLRIPGLTEKLQNEYRVIVSGPTTLYAMLNSLSIGFRTLAIEKRSSEVWKVLGAIKTEFGKFGDLLEGVSKNLDSAQEKLGALRSTRVRAISRKLRAVEALPSAEAERILPLDSLIADDDDP